MKAFICPHCNKVVKAHECVAAIIYHHKCGKVILKKKRGKNEKT